MKTLIYKHDPIFPSDTKRIAKVFKKRGYSLSLQDAQLAWQAFSSSHLASWLPLRRVTDQQIIDFLLPHLREKER